VRREQGHALEGDQDRQAQATRREDGSWSIDNAELAR
jgi:hypothetical protein